MHHLAPPIHDGDATRQHLDRQCSGVVPRSLRAPQTGVEDRVASRQKGGGWGHRATRRRLQETLNLPDRLEDADDTRPTGAKVEVTNPIITLNSAGGRPQAHLTIRERIEWTPLTDGWSVFKGTWKVVGSSGAYRGFKGHGFLAGTWAPETDPNRMLRIRLQGFLNR